MTALTGETGAGKTLVVEALQLVLGGRANAGMVRAGATEALVEARFVVGEGERRASEVILARSVPAEGRSRAWVDGRMAPLARARRGGGGAGRDPRATRAPGPGHAGRAARRARRLRRHRPRPGARRCAASCAPLDDALAQASAATRSSGPARPTSCATRSRRSPQRGPRGPRRGGGPAPGGGPPGRCRGLPRGGALGAARACIDPCRRRGRTCSTCSGAPAAALAGPARPSTSYHARLLGRRRSSCPTWPVRCATSRGVGGRPAASRRGAGAPPAAGRAAAQVRRGPGTRSWPTARQAPGAAGRARGRRGRGGPAAGRARAAAQPSSPRPRPACVRCAPGAAGAFGEHGGRAAGRPGHGRGPPRGPGGARGAPASRWSWRWGPTWASRCSRWPGPPRAASWPGPCWPSAWWAWAARRRWSSTRWTPAWAVRPPWRWARRCTRWRGDRQVLVVTHLAQVASQADAQISVVKHEIRGRTVTTRNARSRARTGSPSCHACSRVTRTATPPGPRPASCSVALAGPVVHHAVPPAFDYRGRVHRSPDMMLGVPKAA